MTGSGYTSNYVGLFGYAGTDSKISNLTITASKIEASGSNRGKNVGAIAGTAYDIENCHVTDSVTVTGSQLCWRCSRFCRELDYSIFQCRHRYSSKQIELVV